MTFNISRENNPKILRLSLGSVQTKIVSRTIYDTCITAIRGYMYKSSICHNNLKMEAARTSETQKTSPP